jgi:FkbM family methyltransferase
MIRVKTWVKSILEPVGLLDVAVSGTRIAREICTGNGRLQRRHRQQTARFYTQFIMPRDLVFDVGANIGIRSAVFLELGAKVVAVEPQENCTNSLRQRFGRRSDFVLVEAALGVAHGEQEMWISNASVLSSMSSAWIACVQTTGRFTGSTWTQRCTVPVTTLDHLIDSYGLPRFCKIDTEGYEYPVLQGLSQPIPSLSFEFSLEYMVSSLHCIDHLASLGPYEFNYSLGESMVLSLDHWVSAETFCKQIVSISDPMAFGDLYARLRD